jgi:dGTPase
MINDVVTDLVEETRRRLAAAAPASIEEVRAHKGPLVAFSDTGAEEHLELKRFLRTRVYEHERVKGMREGAVRTLKELFEAFFTDVDLMPPEHRDTALRLESESGPAGRARAVADYVAGMTDRYAFLEHERVFGPVSGTA